MGKANEIYALYTGTATTPLTKMGSEELYREWQAAQTPEAKKVVLEEMNKRNQQAQPAPNSPQFPPGYANDMFRLSGIDMKIGRTPEDQEYAAQATNSPKWKLGDRYRYPHEQDPVFFEHFKQGVSDTGTRVADALAKFHAAHTAKYTTNQDPWNGPTAKKK